MTFLCVSCSVYFPILMELEQLLIYSYLYGCHPWCEWKDV